MKKSTIYNYLQEVKASNTITAVYEVQGDNKNIITATKEQFVHFITVQPEVLRRLIATKQGFKAFIKYDV